MKAEWQVQKAKAELSTLIEAAQKDPQVITRHGKPVAVVLSYNRYERLAREAGRQSLYDFFRSWPELEIPARDPSDTGRDVDLS